MPPWSDSGEVALFTLAPQNVRREKLMLDILLVALLQAAAGEAAQTVPAQTGEPAAETSQSSEGGIDPRDTVRCHRVRQLGTRTRAELVCTSLRQEEQEREESRRMHERITQPTPTQPASGMGPG